MEIMTLRMQDLAMTTKQETVLMRVITTVTLLFLPATFMAVCTTPLYRVKFTDRV